MTDLADQSDPAWYITPEEPDYGFEKYVNGQDADTLAEAVEVDAGDTLTFRYEVTNEGNVAIEWTGLTDDVFGDLTVECGLPKTIGVGGSDYCEITRTAGDFPEGKENVGTASVTDLADQSDPAWYKTAAPPEPCIELTKSINGPYRTSNDLFLTDGIIPVAVLRDIDPPGPENDNEENLFYFLVEITVTNCGGTELTRVVVEDSFSNEAQPFETDDPGNVTITPPPDPNDGMVHESLTWSVGTIPANESRTLEIKVGTEFNPSGRLEPTSAPPEDPIFYNGRDDSTGSASVTADGGLSASVGAMAIDHGDEISCEGSDGEWYNLDWQTGGGTIRPHDKCAAVTTSLPIMLTDSDGSELTTTSTSSPLQRTAPVAAAGAVATTGLASVAWWLLRRKLLLL